MRRPIKLLAAVAAVLIIAVAAWFIVPWMTGRSDSQQSQTGNSTGGNSSQAAAAKGPVPVMAAKAGSQNIPIIVRGIGNVAAFNEVAVKSRVDGNITKIFYREGQFVRIGDPLIQIDPRPYQAALDQANGLKGKDEANLANAQRDLARDATLVQTQLAATQQQYETQKALVQQLLASVKADQAAVETAQLNLEYSTIRSPIEGVIGLQLVAIGNLVQSGAATTLVNVAQIKPIGVIFTVPERVLPQLRQVAATQSPAVIAFDGEDNKALSQGVLTVINNQVDQTTGTITLKAIFPNDDAALWPGEFVNAHLVLNTVQNGVTIPASAVQMGPNGAFVFVIKPDSTVANQPVTVTQVENNTALIGKGLEAGTSIVVSGQSGLTPGVKVAVQQGAPGQMNAQEPEIGPEGVGSTGINTAPSGAGEINPR
ncbi:MAG: efflux RND transporter periplasmic adaptor subunit [Alphaproteobacteria bacterium]|nr:efflux RND transporter periplasmic adaptor subunit [Alphaproteobacteria bacterium]